MRRSFYRSLALRAEPGDGRGAFRRLLAVAATLLLTLPASAQWVAVKAGQYEVFSNVGVKKAQEAAAGLQRMTAAVSHASDLAVDLRNPTRVLIFRDRVEFTAHAAPLFAGRMGKVGVAVTTTNANYILLDGKASRAGDILFHELAHQFINNSLHDVPLWYSEGLADFYANFRVEKQAVEVGRPVRPAQRARLAKQKMIPMREFFLADDRSRYYTEGTFERKFYSQAWAVVHNLVHERGRDLPRFLELLRARRPVEEAFLDAFGITLQRFERDLQLYLQRPILPSRRMETGTVIVERCGAPRSVPDDEMRAVLADLASVAAQ
jgi:hypothetical protein